MADLTDKELDDRAAKIESLYKEGKDDIAQQVEAEIQVALAKRLRALDQSSQKYARKLVWLTLVVVLLTLVLIALTVPLVRQG